MGEDRSATRSATADTGAETIVVEPRRFRARAAAAAGALLASLACGTVVLAAGWQSYEWLEVIWRSACAAFGAGLGVTMFSLPAKQAAISVSGGFVTGPSGRKRIRFPLGQLDRERFMAELASRRRWLRGYKLRSTSGAAIDVEWHSYDRGDRELLLRALGVAPAAPA